MKLHIVDGTYELFRAHFAQPTRLAPDGMHVSAIRGLIISLMSLINDEQVSHIAVAFDSSIKSFRNQIFPNYKDGSDTPDELLMQFPLAERVVEALGIKCWPSFDYEADDTLGSAAIKFSQLEHIDQVVICSVDKDLCQIVSGEKIVCLDRKNKKIIDEIEVQNKFGVIPSSIPDYLGLMGDAADGIPGIPKWGSKSASSLLARYLTIENIPSDNNLWDVKVRGAHTLSKNLEENRQNAYLYKQLATIKTDVEISDNISDLKWVGVIEKDFVKICDEFGLENLKSLI